MAYEGAKNLQHRLQSCFVNNEDHVICGDESNNSVAVWDSRTGVFTHSIPGHTNVVRALASSPVDIGFMTGR